MLVWPSTNGASRSDQYIHVYQLKTFYSKRRPEIRGVSGLLCFFLNFIETPSDQAVECSSLAERTSCWRRLSLRSNSSSISWRTCSSASGRDRFSLLAHATTRLTYKRLNSSRCHFKSGIGLRWICEQG